MKEDLERLIRQARREVSHASGIPLPPEKLGTERRERESKALNIAIIRDLGDEIYLALCPEVQWDGNQPYATFLIDDIPFEARKDQQVHAQPATTHKNCSILPQTIRCCACAF
jgi:hypothetical protein